MSSTSMYQLTKNTFMKINGTDWNVTFLDYGIPLVGTEETHYAIVCYNEQGERKELFMNASEVHFFEKEGVI